MGKKYYRFLEVPEGNWSPRLVPDSDVVGANFLSHLEDMFLSVPDVGDYLAVSVDGRCSLVCPTSFEKYNGVEYRYMPSLERLLNDGVLVEVPEDIQELDWQLQGRIEALEGAIGELEDKLDELEPKLHERRFFVLTQEAKDCRHIYGELKTMMDGLCLELKTVQNEMEEWVAKPLRELARERKELSMASVDDLIFGASSRGVEVLGKMRELQIEHTL